MHPLQIICARLKILAMPLGRPIVAAVENGHHEAVPGPLPQAQPPPPQQQQPVAAAAREAEAGAAAPEDLAPNILRGGWAPGPGQRRFLCRLRCA
jgi:hypothetical protein